MRRDFYKNYFERSLPHIQPIGSQFFVSFRLHGTLPWAITHLLEEQYQTNIKGILTAHNEDYQQQIYNEQKRSFARYDSYLDCAQTGNRYLQREEIAEVVATKIRNYDGEYYQLIAYCIMPNHVHMVIDTGRHQQDETKVLVSLSQT